MTNEVSDAGKSARPEEGADRVSVTRHRLKMGSKSVRYTAICGRISLFEEAQQDGKSQGRKVRAQMFFIAYILDADQQKSDRPISFAFNGGPGSSAVWLHLGLLGPRRVVLDDEGFAQRPEGGLEPNTYSLLSASDLVFVDPIGTGFSRIVDGEKANEFQDYKRDLESIGEFVRVYCSRYGRWSSPKFLIGESYGTLRAVGLAGHLLERHGMYLQGLMLISCSLDYQQVRFDAGNDLPYVLFLPSYAALAWFHKRLTPVMQQKKLQSFLSEVQSFAEGRYAHALFLGARLEPKVRSDVVAKLAQYTGISADYIERANLRLEIIRFCKELLRERGLKIGRLDGRYTGVDRDCAGEHIEFDASYMEILGPYTAAINHYIRHDLAFDTDDPYEVARPFHESWRWGDFANRYTSVSETLRKMMAMNPHMRVHLASGYYDLATPYFAADYTMDHLELPAKLRGNLTTSYYESGHMMYTQRRSLEDLSAALRRFVTLRG